MDDRALKRLSRFMKMAADYAEPVTLEAIRALIGSERADDRLLGLLLMQQSIGVDARAPEYFEDAEQLIEDADNTCRWQALIVIGECLEDRPELVWKVIDNYGSSEDEDMRMGVATVLLEHLLETHFESYFPLIREKLSAGDRRFAETLSVCWCFGGDDNEHKIRSALRKAARGRVGWEKLR